MFNFEPWSAKTVKKCLANLEKGNQFFDARTMELFEQRAIEVEASLLKVIFPHDKININYRVTLKV